MPNLKLAFEIVFVGFFSLEWWFSDENRDHAWWFQVSPRVFVLPTWGYAWLRSDICGQNNFKFLTNDKMFCNYKTSEIVRGENFNIWFDKWVRRGFFIDCFQTRTFWNQYETLVFNDDICYAEAGSWLICFWIFNCS